MCEAPFSQLRKRRNDRSLIPSPLAGEGQGEGCRLLRCVTESDNKAPLCDGLARFVDVTA